MILEYSVENTFSIKDRQTISFEALVDDDNTNDLHYRQCGDKKILKIACLYGANASGKTKMAKSLYFYIDFIISSFTDLKPDESTHFIPFKFSEETKKQPGKFEIIFYTKDFISNLDKEIKYKYAISLDGSHVVSESLFYSPKGQLKLLFDRKASEGIKWGVDIIGAKKIISEMTRDNCSLISAAAQAKHPFFKAVYDYISKKFKGYITSSPSGLSGYIAKKIDTEEIFKNRVLTLLNSSDIGNITDIKIKAEPIPIELISQLPQELQEDIAKRGERPKTRRMKFVHTYDKEYEISLNEESEGTKRLLELSLPLMDIAISNSFIIIDEIENSLHQQLLETFMKVFLNASSRNNSDSQLLFTTHNQELLDSNLLRDDEVCFCYKNNNGESKYNRITDFKGIRKDMSRKKLYQTGKFGALPNIDTSAIVDFFCKTNCK